MARPMQEVVNYELSKLNGDRNEQKAFFSKSINIQKSHRTYDIGYATRMYDISCNVLATCGFCNGYPCECCKLAAAHMRARKEIFEGIRKKPEKRIKKEVNNGTNTR